VCRNIDSIGVAVTINTHEQDNHGHQDSPARKLNQKKKIYQKPTFRHERVFETMALACGKVSPTQAQCRFNRKNS
jgi:hypothetical protein